MSGRPRVLLACRYPLYRLGIRAALDGAGLTVVGEASTSPETVSGAREHQPDVIVVDSHLRGMQTAQLFSALLEEAPHARTVVLASVTDEHVFAGVEAKVAGYLLRECTAEQLVASIEAAHEGRPVVAADLGPLSVAAYETVRREGTSEQMRRIRALTPREREVLRLLAQGLRNREIAVELYIAENTVKNHVRNILDKLVLGSRVEAAMYALRHDTGQLDPGDA